MEKQCRKMLSSIQNSKSKSKSKSKKNNNFAIIISCISVLISISTITWTIAKDLYANREDIEIFQCSDAINQLTDFTAGAGPLAKSFYSKEYIFALANVTGRDICIINLDAENKTSRSTFGYNDILDTDLIKLPIVIKAHSAETINVKVKYFLDSETTTILLKKYKINSKCNLQEFLKTIYETGVDEFNNMVKYQVWSNSYVLERPNNWNYQKINISFITTEKHTFSSIIKP